ncbi:MAG: restriction endonuclease subunit S [Bacteroidales bacterium]|nr:restriction endonuclease subunit S [Bacteroidales bacterium]
MVDLYSGGTPNKSILEYWDGSIPWISAKSMYEDFLSSSDLYISEAGLRAGSRLAKKGSILLLTRGSGLFNRIPVCWTLSDVAFNQDVKNIKSKDEGIVMSQYLFYWLYAHKSDISAILETTGIGAGKIDTERLLSMSVLLPGISEQEQIIRAIKPFFDIISLNNRINHNLEEQAQALFKSWFIDYDPFKDGDFIDSELGKIPTGWRVRSLGDVTEEMRSKVGFRQDVKVLSPITTGQLLLSEEYFTKQVFSESISKYLIVKPCDFAYNPARVNIGSIGKNEYGFDGCVSPVYVVFRCESGYDLFFDLYRRTDSFKNEVVSRASGGVRQTLGYKDFSLIKLVYPPKVVVVMFNEIYGHLLKEISHCSEENNFLTEQRDILLPKLMSGEVSIY